MKKVLFTVIAAVAVLSGCSANTNNGGDKPATTNQETMKTTNAAPEATDPPAKDASAATDAPKEAAKDAPPTDAPKEAAKDAPAADKAADGVKVDDLVFKQLSAKGVAGMWSGAVDIENTGDTDYQVLLFTVSFYKGDKRLGVATGALSGDLAKGDTKTAQFVSTDDLNGFDSVKIQVDSKM